VGCGLTDTTDILTGASTTTSGDSGNTIAGTDSGSSLKVDNGSLTNTDTFADGSDTQIVTSSGQTTDSPGETKGDVALFP